MAGEWRQRTVPAASFEPNPWGLYQVHGNVREWCEDCWHDSYAGKPENLKQTGAAWRESGSELRVIRGGSWFSRPYRLRSAVRFRFEAYARYSDLGFRIARELPHN
jgi:formylglycine-generating enzyme required for sulfatase activity